MTNIFTKLILSVLVLTTLTISVQAADKQPIIIGGSALANAIDETNLVGALTGTFQGGARAAVLGETKTENGLILHMEHYFLNELGGLIRTKDKAVLTNVADNPGIYMIEINYEIQQATGAYADYTGEFHSRGLYDANTGIVVLRYDGTIYK